jgi:hypothetical protein
MDIKINDIPLETVDVYHNGEYFGTVNEYQFTDLRVQILKNQAEGFSVLFDGAFYMITENGSMDFWPIGMFDFLVNHWQTLLCREW